MVSLSFFAPPSFGLLATLILQSISLLISNVPLPDVFLVCVYCLGFTLIVFFSFYILHIDSEGRTCVIEEYEGLSLADETIIVPRDSPRPSKRKLAVQPSYPLSLLMGVSIILNVNPLTGYCDRRSPGRHFVF